MDDIYLKLPNGREVLGKALIVNDTIHIPSGAGEINNKFTLFAETPAMEVCCVLVMVTREANEKIVL